LCIKPLGRFFTRGRKRVCRFEIICLSFRCRFSGRVNIRRYIFRLLKFMGQFKAVLR